MIISTFKRYFAWSALSTGCLSSEERRYSFFSFACWTILHLFIILGIISSKTLRDSKSSSLFLGLDKFSALSHKEDSRSRFLYRVLMMKLT